MMVFKDRLKIAMKEESVLGFAKKSGLSEGAIRQYLKGSEPGLDKVIAIAAAAGVSAAWLATGEGKPDSSYRSSALADSSVPSQFRAQPLRSKDGEEMYLSMAAANTSTIKLDKSSYEAKINEVDDTSSVAVPLLSIHASAGGGAAVLSEEGDDYIRFSARMLRGLGLEPLHTFVMPVLGDSMEPRIRSGELMLCSRAPQHLKGADGTYIVRLEGDILVKRIQRLPGGKVVVSSENTGYSPFEIILNDGVDFAILGMVLVVFRKV